MALRPKLSTTQKHQIFVEEYLRTLNATQAALAAGYSKSNARNQGYLLLQDPDIARQVDTLLAQRCEQCRVDTQFVIEQAKAVVLDQRVPARDRVKALDLLGRYTGAWSGVSEVKTTNTIEVRLSD